MIAKLPHCLIASLLLQTPQATFKSSIELINVDVVVVDAQGNTVRGLTAADFALTDRKKPQTISTFEEVSHERATATPSRATMFPATLKMDVVDNQTSQADRLVMLVVDDLHIWKGRTDKAKELARDVVTKLGAQASMAVVFTSGNNSTQVTQDRSELLTAIGKMQGRQSLRRPHQAVDDQKAPPEAGLDGMAAAQKVSLQDFQENLTSFEIMNDAAKMLRADDQRRKAFVLISEGMSKDMSGLFDATVSPCENVSMQNPCYHDRALRDMSESLRRSNVATYAIDPRGKVRPEDMMLESWPPPDCAACGLTPGAEDSQFKWNNPIRLAQSSLAQLSEATGGFAVTDTDDFTSGLQKIIEDIDHYYLLGFYPADAGGGNKYRPLAVSVPAHPDWTIRYRRGYTPAAAATTAAPKDPLSALASGVMPKSDLPLRITALPMVGKGKNASVAIALEVTAPTGLMKDADSKLRDDVTYAVLVIDDKKAKVTSRTGRAASFAMSATNATIAMPDTVTYQIPLTIDLAPGQYQLRASAMSKKLGQGGSVYLTVNVPDYTKQPLVLSGLVLGFADGSHVPVGRAASSSEPISSRAPMGSSRTIAQAGNAARGVSASNMPEAPTEARRLPFDPALTREFTNADTLRMYFEVARRDTSTTVALTIMVIDANNRAIMAIDRSVGPGEAGKVDLRVPLAPLGAGAYRLRVTATDSRTVAQSETGIVIK